MKIANQEVRRVDAHVGDDGNGNYQVNLSVTFDNPHHVTLEKIKAKKAELGEKGFIEWRRGEDRLADNIGAEVKAHFKPKMDSLEERFGTKGRLKGTSYGPAGVDDNIVLASSIRSPQEVIKRTRAATYAMLTEALGASPQEAEQYVKSKIEFPKEMQALAASMPFPEQQPKTKQQTPQPKPGPKLPEPGLLATNAGMNYDFDSSLRKYANELKATWPETEQFNAARNAVDSLVSAASRYGQDTAAGNDASKHQRKVADVRYIDMKEIQDPKAREQVAALLEVVDKSMVKTNMQRILDQDKATSPPPKLEPKNNFLDEAKVEAGTGKNQKNAPQDRAELPQRIPPRNPQR